MNNSHTPELQPPKLRKVSQDQGLLVIIMYPKYNRFEFLMPDT